MIAPQYQLNKSRRFVTTYGQEFKFQRPAVNEYGEPTDQGEEITVKGVYHEALGYVYLTKSTTESTTRRQRVFPMILMLWEEAEKLVHTDRLTYNGHLYQVGEINNIGEANVVADVSLMEVVGP